VHDLPGLGDLVHVVIQGDVLVGDEAGFLGVVLGHPAQDHTQSGDDLFQGEGLGDVVVRADSRPWIRSSTPSLAVRNRAGASWPASRSLLSRVKPSMPGIMTSRMKASGR